MMTGSGSSRSSNDTPRRAGSPWTNSPTGWARVYNAATHADLARVTHDLPATVPAVPAAPMTEQRHLVVAFLLAAVTIVLLALALWAWKLA